MAARTELIRDEVTRLIRQQPFRPFALNLENGDRIVIEHSDNIAFEPGNGNGEGSRDFYVLSQRLRHYGPFEAVTSVSLIDVGAI
jgi:hypothetical protein